MLNFLLKNFISGLGLDELEDKSESAESKINKLRDIVIALAGENKYTFKFSPKEDENLNYNNMLFQGYTSTKPMTDKEASVIQSLMPSNFRSDRTVETIRT